MIKFYVFIEYQKKIQMENEINLLIGKSYWDISVRSDLQRRTYGNALWRGVGGSF